MINTKFIVKVDRGGTHALESWKDLYQAAIFEPDLNKLPERIAGAESALNVRGSCFTQPETVLKRGKVWTTP
jgi:hypothetical protein